MNFYPLVASQRRRFYLYAFNPLKIGWLGLLLLTLWSEMSYGQGNPCAGINTTINASCISLSHSTSIPFVIPDGITGYFQLTSPRGNSYRSEPGTGTITVPSQSSEGLIFPPDPPSPPRRFRTITENWTLVFVSQGIICPLPNVTMTISRDPINFDVILGNDDPAFFDSNTNTLYMCPSVDPGDIHLNLRGKGGNGGYQWSINPVNPPALIRPNSFTYTGVYNEFDRPQTIYDYFRYGWGCDVTFTLPLANNNSPTQEYYISLRDENGCSYVGRSIFVRMVNPAITDFTLCPNTCTNEPENGQPDNNMSAWIGISPTLRQCLSWVRPERISYAVYNRTSGNSRPSYLCHGPGQDSQGGDNPIIRGMGVINPTDCAGDFTGANLNNTPMIPRVRSNLTPDIDYYFKVNGLQPNVEYSVVAAIDFTYLRNPQYNCNTTTEFDCMDLLSDGFRPERFTINDGNFIRKLDIESGRLNRFKQDPVIQQAGCNNSGQIVTKLSLTTGSDPTTPFPTSVTFQVIPVDDNNTPTGPPIQIIQNPAAGPPVVFSNLAPHRYLVKAIYKNGCLPDDFFPKTTPANCVKAAEECVKETLVVITACTPPKVTLKQTDLTVNTEFDDGFTINGWQNYDPNYFYDVLITTYPRNNDNGTGTTSRVSNITLPFTYDALASCRKVDIQIVAKCCSNSIEGALSNVVTIKTGINLVLPDLGVKACKGSIKSVWVSETATPGVTYRWFSDASYTTPIPNSELKDNGRRYEGTFNADRTFYIESIQDGCTLRFNIKVEVINPGMRTAKLDGPTSFCTSINEGTIHVKDLPTGTTVEKWTITDNQGTRTVLDNNNNPFKGTSYTFSNLTSLTIFQVEFQDACGTYTSSWNVTQNGPITTPTVTCGPDGKGTVTFNASSAYGYRLYGTTDWKDATTVFSGNCGQVTFPPAPPSPPCPVNPVLFTGLANGDYIFEVRNHTGMTIPLTPCTTTVRVKVDCPPPDVCASENVHFTDIQRVGNIIKFKWSPASFPNATYLFTWNINGVTRNTNANTNSFDLRNFDTSCETTIKVKVRVRCTTGGGNTLGPYSPETTFTIGSITTCTPPVLNTPTNVTVDRATLTWTNGTGTTQYQLLFGPAGLNQLLPYSGWNNLQPFTTISPLLASCTAYEFRLVGICPCSEERFFSNIVRCTTQADVSNLNFVSLAPVQQNNNYLVPLNWTAVNGQSYAIKWIKSNNQTETFNNVRPPYFVKGVQPCSSNEFQITAKCNISNVPSQPVSLNVTTPGCNPPVCVGENELLDFTYRETQCDQEEINWNRVNNATGYVIEYRRRPNGTSQTVRVPQNQFTARYSQTITGLSFNTDYEIRIFAEFAGGGQAPNCPYLPFTTCGVGTNCVYPDVQVQPGCSTAVINWNTIEGATGYQITYEEEGNPLGEVRVLATNIQPGYILTGLNPNKVYHLKIQALPNGRTDCESVVFETSDCAPPSKCVATASVNLDCRSAQLDWSAVPGFSCYLVSYRDKSPVSAWRNNVTSTTSFNLTNLTPDKEYEYRILAIPSCNTGYDAGACTIGSFRTKTCVTLPYCVTPTVVPDCNKIQFDWSAVPGATCYRVWWRKKGASRGVYTNTSNTSFNLKNMLPDTEYEYRIIAATSCGTNLDLSICSVGVTRTRPKNDCGPYPPIQCVALTPTNIETKSSLCNQAIVRWTAIPGATHYRVEYRKVGQQFPIVLTVNGTTQYIYYLEPDTDYEVRVQSIDPNRSSQSLNCNYTAFRTCGGCGTACNTCLSPTFMTNNFYVCGTAYLGWTAVTGASCYEVYIRTTNQETYQYYGRFNAPTTNTVVAGLQSGLTYQVKVVARKDCNGPMIFNIDNCSAQTLAISCGGGPTNNPTSVCINNARSTVSSDCKTLTVSWDRTGVSTPNVYVEVLVQGSPVKKYGPFNGNNVTSYQIPFTPGQNHSVRVYALSSTNGTPPSNCGFLPVLSSCKTDCPNTPIQNFVLTSNKPNEFYGTWTAIPNITGYRVRFRKIGSQSWTSFIDCDNSSFWSGRVDPGNYEVEVCHINPKTGLECGCVRKTITVGAYESCIFITSETSSIKNGKYIYNMRWNSNVSRGGNNCYELYYRKHINTFFEDTRPFTKIRLENPPLSEPGSSVYYQLSSDDPATCYEVFVRTCGSTDQCSTQVLCYSPPAPPVIDYCARIPRILDGRVINVTASSATVIWTPINWTQGYRVELRTQGNDNW